MEKYQVAESFITEDDAVDFVKSMELEEGEYRILRTPALKSVGIARVPSGSYHVVLKASLLSKLIARRRSNPNFPVHTGSKVNQKVDTRASGNAMQRKVERDGRANRFQQVTGETPVNKQGTRHAAPFSTTRDDTGKPVHGDSDLLPGEQHYDKVRDSAVNILGPQHDAEIAKRDAGLSKQLLTPGAPREAGQHHGSEVKHDPVEATSQVGQPLDTKIRLKAIIKEVLEEILSEV